MTLGSHAGFTVDEMADIVGSVLVDMGLTRRLAPVIAIVGHGSSSLNNPHESAHDCGACGGGRGGPNARAFTRMANDGRVRTLLRARGLDIPPSTVFIGAYHDSCNDGVALYDVEETDTPFARPEGNELLARIYRPKGTPAGPLAALVDVHGGAWSRLDRTSGNLTRRFCRVRLTSGHETVTAAPSGNAARASSSRTAVLSPEKLKSSSSRPGRARGSACARASPVAASLSIFTPPG